MAAVWARWTARGRGTAGASRSPVSSAASSVRCWPGQETCRDRMEAWTAAWPTLACPRPRQPSLAALTVLGPALSLILLSAPANAGTAPPRPAPLNTLLQVCTHSSSTEACSRTCRARAAGPGCTRSGSTRPAPPPSSSWTFGSRRCSPTRPSTASSK